VRVAHGVLVANEMVVPVARQRLEVAGIKVFDYRAKDKGLERKAVFL